VFGDVGQPHLVRAGGGELVADTAVLVDDREQVVMDRGTGLAFLLVVTRPDSGQEPVPQRGVTSVDTAQCVDRVRIIPITL